VIAVEYGAGKASSGGCGGLERLIRLSIAALARTVGREDSGWPVAVGWARRGSLMGPSWSTPVTLWCW